MLFEKIHVVSPSGRCFVPVPTGEPHSPPIAAKRSSGLHAAGRSGRSGSGSCTGETQAGGTTGIRSALFAFSLVLCCFLIKQRGQMETHHIETPLLERGIIAPGSICFFLLLNRGTKWKPTILRCHCWSEGSLYLVLFAFFGLNRGTK